MEGTPFTKRTREAGYSIKLTVPSEVADKLDMKPQEKWLFSLDGEEFKANLSLAGSPETKSLEIVIPKEEVFLDLDYEVGDVVTIYAVKKIS